MSSPGTPHHSPLPSQSAPFYFPGPSSRYNCIRPRPQTSKHIRPKSYTPIAPVLSTERRAHRRAHTQKSSISSAPSPPASEYSRSPLSRFSSFSAKMAAQMPQTPAKASRQSTSSLQDSPFSDYFTDEARSVDAHVSTNDTKQLLVRMNRLQSRLMRDHSNSGREAIHIVGRKLSEIEVELSTLHSQTRMPLDLGDSAVFMDDEQDIGGKLDQTATESHAQPQDPYSDEGDMEAPTEPVTIEQYKAERDYFIVRMQDLLEKLGTTQTELGKRYAEVHELNEFHNSQLEECETQLEQLRSENEGLRSDLGFEYSELLFLKLQMKSLEVDMDTLNNDGPDGLATTPAQRAVAAKKNRILSEMDRWRSDWEDVDARFKRRRSKYGVSLESRDSTPTSEAVPTAGETEWHLETTKEKEGRGRITSLTIRRMDSSGGPTEDVTAEEASSSATTLKQAETVGLDGLNISITKGSSEPQIAKPSNPYKEHSTQTDFPLVSTPSSQDEKVDHPKEEEEVVREEDDGQHHDCAITTSSEFEDDDDEEDDEKDQDAEEKSTVPSRSRTAWQELWSSLAHLSGLPDDDEDDDI